jgi:hypothetical protein
LMRVQTRRPFACRQTGKSLPPNDISRLKLSFTD